MSSHPRSAAPRAWLGTVAVVFAVLLASIAGTLLLESRSPGTAEADTALALSPGAASTGGCIPNATNAIANDSVYSTCTNNEVIVFTGFNLQSSIPANATSIRFMVHVNALDPDPGGTFNTELSDTGGTTWEGPVATGVSPTGTDATVTAPPTAGCADWGTTWSYADLANANFALRVTVNHPRAPMACRSMQ